MARKKKKDLTEPQRALEQQGSREQARRTRWEHSPEGSKRMRDVRDLVGVEKPRQETREEKRASAQQWEELGTQRPWTLGDTRGGYTLPQMYAVEDWHTGIQQGMAPEHLVHDDQPHIPGLENREAAPLSSIDRARKRGAERWEDLSPRDQEDTARRVRAKSGATLESMTESFGAQVDQGIMRASDRGQMPPLFYGGGEPHAVVQQTVEDLGVSRGAVSALHSDNSPKSPFAVGGGSSNIPRRYPQDDLARAAHASAVKRGEAVHGLTAGQLQGDRPAGAMGYKENFAKSVRRAEQIVGQGIPAGETNPNTTAAGFGPKTGPYQRAWTGGTSSQFVADVHSGGGGMVPHLGTSQETPTGKSEREDAIAVSGYHLMADKAARDANRQRGIHSPAKRPQEIQWAEEQIQRPDLSQTEESVYGPGHVDRDELTGRLLNQGQFEPADPRQMRLDIP